MCIRKKSWVFSWIASPSHKHWVANAGNPKASLDGRKEEPETDSGEDIDEEKEGARAMSGTVLARSLGLQKDKLDCIILGRCQALLQEETVKHKQRDNTTFGSDR